MREAQEHAERQQAEVSLRKSVAEQRMLSQALAQLLSAEAPDRIIHELFPKVAAHLRVDTYLNFMVNEQGDALLLHSYAGLSEQEVQGLQRLEFGQSLCGTVARTKQPVVVNDLQQCDDHLAALARRLGLQAYACHPLLSGEKLLGTLSFASRSRSRFEPSEVEFMRSITNYAAVAVDRARVAHELRQSEERLRRAVQERTAELQQTIGELEQMSYSMIHDMRAPLRAIQSFGSLLQDDPQSRLSEEGQNLLARMKSAAHRMDCLVRDALDYAKVLRQELPLEALDLGALAGGIVQTYPDLQPPKARVKVAPDLPWVLGNQGALTQCLSHLLDNALKFTQPGQTPQIEVFAEHVNDGWVRVVVADKGIGIAPQFQERLFRMFERLVPTPEGTGMGLAIVKKAAERMGGRVGLNSEPGQGSRFWLELKAAEQTQLNNRKNPKGIPSVSPGLRAASYPGTDSRARQSPSPKKVDTFPRV